jgi:hypothetical protein
LFSHNPFTTPTEADYTEDLFSKSGATATRALGATKVRRRRARRRSRRLSPRTTTSRVMSMMTLLRTVSSSRNMSLSRSNKSLHPLAILLLLSGAMLTNGRLWEHVVGPRATARKPKRSQWRQRLLVMLGWVTSLMKRAFGIILIIILRFGAKNVPRKALWVRGEIGTGDATGVPISGILSGLVAGRELCSNQPPIVVEAISTSWYFRCTCLLGHMLFCVWLFGPPRPFGHSRQRVSWQVFSLDTLVVALAITTQMSKYRRKS